MSSHADPGAPPNTSWRSRHIIIISPLPFAPYFNDRARNPTLSHSLTHSRFAAVRALSPCAWYLPPQAFRVQVPAGVSPGQTFHANIGGRLVAVNVPAGVMPGQLLQLQVPVMVQAQPNMQQQQQMAMMQQRQQQIAMQQQQALQQQQRVAMMQQTPAPRAPAPMQRAQSNFAPSMNEQMAAQREAEKKAEELAKQRAEAQKQAIEDAKQAAKEAKKDHRPSAARQAAPVNLRTGGVNAGPGEVSALWWLNMGL